MNNGQTILVAGATGSIGGAAALALVKNGARIVLLGRKQEKLDGYTQRIQNELTKNKIQFDKDAIQTLTIDFGDMESVKWSAGELLSRYREINGLVLSVGAYLENGPNILANGHEAMFATNVVGPFLFTQLLVERLEQSNGLVLHVIAPFTEKIDWDNLESKKNHKTMPAFNRTKMLNRVFAGELARRYAGKISSIAFDPAYVIDKSDPNLNERWPSGFTGLVWKIMTLLFAKHPSVAGEPIAELILKHSDRAALNGALYKLDKPVDKPDPAMNDRELGKRFWDELDRMITHNA